MSSLFLAFCLLASSSAPAAGSPALACLDDSDQPVTSCSECLWHPGCVWCPERPYVDQPAVGCIREGSYDCQGGPDQLVESNPTVTVTRSVPLTLEAAGHGHAGHDHVQLSPQRARVDASPNRAVSLDFSVALADVPVDVYFVMDLSNSMAEHQQNLVAASLNISRQVTTLTSDYQLGFGSFSDKPTPPFASELSYYARATARGTRTQPPPYSFRHQLPLTTDVEKFRRGVEDSPLAGNIDSPEAGMDALMQAITCEEVIGWRDGVRKVIIFITDQDSHFAYDGKLAGLPTPQDGQCSTRLGSAPGEDPFWEYQSSLMQDYPSFGQIRDQLNDKNMVVIFAVTEYMDAIYRELSRFLQGTENIGHLTKDASSLEDIVLQQYEQIKSRIVLQVEKGTDGDGDVEVGLTSDCANPGSNFLTCSGVGEGDVVNFTATVKLSEDACRGDNSDEVKTVKIKLSGFEDEALVAEVHCEKCECESREERGSDVCSGVGDLVCGGCECPTTHSGRSCECRLDDASGQTAADLEDQCRRNGGEAGPICEGRGNCFCGGCHCEAGFLGRYCQCDRECPFAAVGGEGEAKECSGKGVCQCDKDEMGSQCSCQEGWSGVDCSCPPDDISDEYCRDALTGQVCFGRGICSCGLCQCQDGYEGKFCQRSSEVSTCQKLEPCVKAHQFGMLATANSTGGSVEEYDAAAAEYWSQECFKATSFDGEVLFGEHIFTGCPLDDGEERLIYHEDGELKTCESIIVEFIELQDLSQSELERTGRAFSSSNSTTPPPPAARSGAFGQAAFASSSLRRASTENMQRCVGEHNNCEYVFYHDNFETDEFFSEKRGGSIFVVHRNVSGSFRALATCAPDSMLLILGGTAGTLLLVGVGLIVAAIVAVNLADLRRWKQYQAWLEENQRRLGEHQNPLYQEKAQATESTFQNPAYGQ